MVLGYEHLWKAIIRPPRANYEIKDMGPSKFIVNGVDGNSFKVERTDFTIVNARGHDIACSHFEPYEEDRQYREMPCVVYMHGNSSCRLESLDCVHYLLPLNITVFCFDFSGCGMSQGEFISLGWWEREDVALIIEHLRAERRVSTVGLWGRSMGAATALLHADRDHSIGGLVLDSPFSNLPKLANELAYQYMKIPNMLVNPILKMVASSIKSKADFDIYKLSPIDHVDKAFIPAFFATAKDDDFVAPHHAKMLHDKYSGDKNFVDFEGDHNSTRPPEFFDQATFFLMDALQCTTVLNVAGNKFTKEEMLIRKEEIKRKKKAKRKLEEEKKKEENGPKKPLSRTNMAVSMAPQPKNSHQEDEDLPFNFSDDEGEQNKLPQNEFKMRSPSEVLQGQQQMAYEDVFGGMGEDNFVMIGKEDLEMEKAIAMSLENMTDDDQLRLAMELSRKEEEEAKKKKDAKPEDKSNLQIPLYPSLAEQPQQPHQPQPPLGVKSSMQPEAKKDNNDDDYLLALAQPSMASPSVEQNLLELDDKSIPQEEPSPDKEGAIRKKNENISEFLTEQQPLTATKSAAQNEEEFDFFNFKIDDPKLPEKKEEPKKDSGNLIDL